MPTIYEDENKPYHAWYSDKQRKIAGVVIYLTKDGKEILCTEVTVGKENFSKFDDKIYLGEVYKFVRIFEQKNRIYDNWR